MDGVGSHVCNSQIEGGGQAGRHRVLGGRPTRASKTLVVRQRTDKMILKGPRERALGSCGELSHRGAVDAVRGGGAGVVMIRGDRCAWWQVASAYLIIGLCVLFAAVAGWL